MADKKRIALLGSTGSIGTQVLEVIAEHPDKFEISLLSAHNNYELLIEQSKKFKPNTVVITNEDNYDKVESVLWDLEIKSFAGHKALSDCVQMDEVDIVVAAIVGYAGLESVLAAIDAGKNIALANKETLVVAGEIVTKAASKKGINIYPIDSEHSAIFQCLMGEYKNPIEKIVLTASGGPFRGFSSEQLDKVTIKEALNHPNWTMGDKITIDSASMMNKGLEVIEAKWLFDLKPEQIEVIVHPESIVHSLVQFEDGSMKAQLGLPDMKLPIQFALSYPERFKTSWPRFDFSDFSTLNFEKVDLEVFDNLKLAFEVLERGGNSGAAVNAANEVSVAAFLAGTIKFTEIAQINRAVFNDFEFIKSPTIEQLIETDSKSRALASVLIAQ
ncbi:MAG: 1-deoxy-D-xylulose-5-phosphate reductoisomerase [Arenicella sp.]|jgi:1-deoxy-D-xylulose-5-phosphate reductoisomerase